MNAEPRLVTVRCVVAAQTVLVIFIAWYWRAGWEFMPSDAEGPIELLTMSTVVTLPIRGLAAVHRSGLVGWRFAAHVIFQMALWFTLFIAVLPTVQ